MLDSSTEIYRKIQSGEMELLRADEVAEEHNAYRQEYYRSL